MHLTNEEVPHAMSFLLKEKRPELVVMHDGKRYGGFSSLEHAKWVAYMDGWKDAVFVEDAK